MADENPYAKYVTGDKVSTKSITNLVNPYAKYKEPEVGTLEDVGKGSLAGLGSGVIGIPGFMGDMTELLSHGSKAAGDYIGGKMGFEKSPDLLKGNILPTSRDLQSDVEKVTGPFYQAKTPAGKAAQTGASVIPGLALGGETALGLLAKAAGAGVVSEGAGEAANALKGHLPKGAQPYAEPVARAVGAVGGTFAPAAIRRAITPLPMSDPQFATVNALRARDPDFPMTAGQATESPRLMGLEARSPRMGAIPEQQERAFTGGVMNEAGIPGNDFRDIGPGGDAVGQALGQLHRSGSINQTEFQALQQEILNERRRLVRAQGNRNTPAVDDVRDMVRFGAQNNGTPVFDMPGPRYEFMRGELQRRIDGAASPQERHALSNIREALDRGFANTVGPTVAGQANNLENQYANVNVLRNIPPRVGRETVTPQEVLSAVGHNWGNPAANANRGSLAPYAQDASRVMTPLPNAPPEGPLSRVLGAVGGMLVGGGAGASTGGMPAALSEGIVGAILGGERGHDIASLAKSFTGRVAGTGPMQNYLGNQAWRPGPNTTSDSDLIAKMLLTPPVNQAGQQ